jgi:hypothetical protein
LCSLPLSLLIVFCRIRLLWSQEPSIKFFQLSNAQSFISQLYCKALINCKRCENCESNHGSPCNDIYPFFHEDVFPKVQTWFIKLLQHSNGKLLSLQQETRSYVSGLPLGLLCVTVITATYVVLLLPIWDLAGAVSHLQTYLVWQIHQNAFIVQAKGFDFFLHCR